MTMRPLQQCTLAVRLTYSGGTDDVSTYADILPVYLVYCRRKSFFFFLRDALPD